MKHPKTARRLRYALSTNNLKPKELSDLCGISKASISQYYNGAHIPSNISAGKMASILGVSPLWLMGFDVPPQDDAKSVRNSLYNKIEKLDDIDRAKIEERVDIMLESDKYGGE